MNGMRKKKKKKVESIKWMFVGVGSAQSIFARYDAYMPGNPYSTAQPYNMWGQSTQTGSSVSPK